MSGARAWLQIAEAAAAHLSRPRVDPGHADADIERLVRGSWLWTTGQRTASAVSAAWLESMCRRIARAATGVRP